MKVRIFNGSNFNASKFTAILFSIFGAFFGLEHGVGEILQGNTPTPGLKIYAYSAPGLAFPFGREPALSVVHNYLISGILTIVFGLIIIIWSIKLLEIKFGGLGLLCLSIIFFLTGGGFGPFTTLIFAGIAALKIKSNYIWCKRLLPFGLRTFAAKLFPYVTILFLSWIPFELTLGYFFGISYPYPGYFLAYIFPVVMIINVLAAFSHDSLQEKNIFSNDCIDSHV